MTTANSSQVQETGPIGSNKGRALWVQYPRRMLLLVAAFGVTLFLIYSISGAVLPPDPVVLDATASTVSLLVAAVLLATAVGGVLAIGAVLVHSIHSRIGWLGALLKAIGRLSLFSVATIPIAALSLLTILGAFLLLETPPIAGSGTGLQRQLLVILLAGGALSLYPALVAAQATARMLAFYEGARRWQHWAAGLLTFLGTILIQTGGLLSAIVVVEALFARPGLGRVLILDALRREMALVPETLAILALLILMARLVAEFCYWMAGLLLRNEKALPDAATATEGRRRVWLPLALLLLLIPLGLAVWGQITPAGAALEQDLQARLSPPSMEHPLGTDQLGRDIWARVRVAAANTLTRSFLSAGLILFPAMILSMLVGALSGKSSWLWQSVGDLLLFPVDVLLFIPIIPGAVTLLALMEERSGIMAVVVVAGLLLARAVRAGRELWMARTTAADLLHGLTVLLSLLTGSFFMAFSLLYSLEFLGFGLLPPTPSLGFMLQDLQAHLAVIPRALAFVALLIALCSFALYTVTDAFISFSSSKRPMAHFNE